MAVVRRGDLGIGQLTKRRGLGPAAAAGPFSTNGRRFGVNRHRRLHHKTAGAGVGHAEPTQRRQRQRLYDVPLTARGVRRKRTDKPFNKKSGQRRRGERHVLLGETALSDRGRNPGREFGGKRPAKRNARRIEFGIDRLGDGGISQPTLAQRSHREGHDRSRERGQRTRRPVRGVAERANLAVGEFGQQRRNEVGLAGEVAIDRTRRDAGAAATAAI